MHSEIPSKWTLLLLLVGLCASNVAAITEAEAPATESIAEPAPSESMPEENKQKSGAISISAEDAAAIKKLVIHIPWEQEKASWIMPHAQISPISGNVHMDMFAAAITNLTNRDSYIKASSFPPEGKETPVVSINKATSFNLINKKLKQGFLQSIQQTMEAPFKEKTWLDSFEIQVPDKKTSFLPAWLKKQQRKGSMPDTAIVARSRFAFAPDIYRLWFLTDIEIHRVHRATSRQKRPETELLHLEKFASLYDLRDHFEIPTREGEPAQQEAFLLWKKDNGKLYFDTVSALAAENAKMLGHFLKQAPTAVQRTANNPAVMAFYETKKPEPKPEKIRKAPATRQERIAAEREARLEAKRLPGKIEEEKREQLKEREKDGETMEQMNALQREAYMLGKKYEYVLMTEILDNTQDRVISRDLDRNFYYSFPKKNMRLIMQNEIDEDALEQIVLEYREKEGKRRKKKN